jgi:hypothetical protein
VFNHQSAIAIDAEGNVVDGQHRCAAVIKAGISIQVKLVTYNEVFTNAMLVAFDLGKSRTVSDVTHISPREIAIYNCIGNLFSGISSVSLDPEDIKYMAEASHEDIEFISANLLSISSSTPSKEYTMGLLKIWTAPIKAVCIAGLQDKLNIMHLNEFTNKETKRKDIIECREWYEEYSGTLNSKHASTQLLAIFWNILKYKKFISDRDFDKISENLQELRKIYTKKYPALYKPVKR